MRFFDGVLEVSEDHFWVCCGGSYIGSCHVKVRAGVDVVDMLMRIRKRFAVAVDDMTVQIATTAGGDNSARGSPLLSMLATDGENSPKKQLGGKTSTKRGGGGGKRIMGGDATVNSWGVLSEEGSEGQGSKHT